MHQWTFITFISFLYHHWRINMFLTIFYFFLLLYSQALFLSLSLSLSLFSLTFSSDNQNNLLIFKHVHFKNASVCNFFFPFLFIKIMLKQLILFLSIIYSIQCLSARSNSKTICSWQVFLYSKNVFFCVFFRNSLVEST